METTLSENTITIAEDPVEINETQHIDVLNHPDYNGRYYYKIAVEGPWILIDKTGKESVTKTFVTLSSLLAWCKTPAPSNGMAFAASAGAAHVDQNDPMAIMQEAQVASNTMNAFAQAAEAAITSEQPGVGVAVQGLVSELAGFTADTVEDEATIRRLVSEQESSFLAAVRAQKAADSALLAAKQQFEAENPDLFAEVKIADAKVKACRTVLDPLLIRFRELTDEAKFDEYLSTKVTEIVEIADEALAVTWAEENYPAAINKVLNAQLIVRYAKDQLKQGNLPVWASARTEIKPTISSKI